MTNKDSDSVRALSVIFNGYGGILLLYFVLRFTVGDQMGIVALFSNFLPLALLPALGALVYSFNNKSRFMILWTSVAIVFFAIEYGPRFIPRIEYMRNSSTYLTILSHNTGQNLPGYNLRDEIIRDSNADIVILQEVTEEYMEDHFSALLDLYPYQVRGPLQDSEGRMVGMGILSRYPILGTKDFKLHTEGLVYQQRVVIDIGNQPIVVYNIHTTFPWLYMRKDPVFAEYPWPVYDDSIRRKEIAKLSSLLEQEKGLVIIAGDFNLTDQSSDYKKLLSACQNDAFRNAGYGLGFTWPANRTPSVNLRFTIPVVRVDYLFYSPGLQSNSARVLRETGSDHKPILISLALEE